MTLPLLLLMACTGGDFSLVVDADDDGSPSDLDCNDSDPALHPGAEERCDGIDNDCDGLVDDDDDGLVTTEAGTWYADADRDGHGAGDVVRACEAPDGTATSDGDCDDARADVHPDAEEVCDGLDNDCNALIDDQPVDGKLAFVDSDGDGDGGPVSLGRACEASPGVSLSSTDCDDNDPEVHPSGQERCGGGDEDCDGALDDLDDSVDPDSFATFYVDADGDTEGGTTELEACAQAPGRSSTSTDCDDADPTVFSAQVEVCNSIDDNCNGLVDDEDPLLDKTGAQVFYPDNDADGFGDDRLAEAWCSARLGLSDIPGDCNDTTNTVNPDAPERCDGLDNDCDGRVDVALHEGPAWQLDDDEDGYGSPETHELACEAPTLAHVSASVGDDCDDADSAIHPGLDEICDNGIDDNCDESPSPCGMWGAVAWEGAEQVAWYDTVLQQDGGPPVSWRRIGRDSVRMWDVRPIDHPDYIAPTTWLLGSVTQPRFFMAELDDVSGPELYIRPERNSSRLYRRSVNPSVHLLHQPPFNDKNTTVQGWVSGTDSATMQFAGYSMTSTAHALHETYGHEGGTLRVVHTWPQGAANPNITTIAGASSPPDEADFDGDGQWDLFVRFNQPEGSVNGVFLGPLASSLVAADARSAWSVSLTVVPDLDEDGHPDLRENRQDPDPNSPPYQVNLYTFPEIADNTVPDPSQAHTWMSLSVNVTPTFSDFDGDGTLDMATRGPIQPKVRFFHGPLSGEIDFTAPTGWIVPPSDGHGEIQFVPQDLDGDGDGDIYDSLALIRGAGL